MMDIENAEAMLLEVAGTMRQNSERWFPNWYDGSLPMPTWAGFALGLGGEAGEAQNIVKKMVRDGTTEKHHQMLGEELADVFTYLLLLADDLGFSLIEEWQSKVRVMNERFGG